MAQSKSYTSNLKISEKYNSNIFKNQKYVKFKPQNRAFEGKTNLDKNIQDIDKWLNIYKSLRKNAKIENKLKKISMKNDKYFFNYMGAGTSSFSFR